MQTVGCADFIVGMFGVQRLLGDIDRGREFWRDAARTGSTQGRDGHDDGPGWSNGNVVTAVLDWVVGEGFREFFDRGEDEMPFGNAADFRQRHLITMTKAMIGMLKPGGM